MSTTQAPQAPILLACGLHTDTLALRWADAACDALQAEVASALELQQIQARRHNLLVYGTAPCALQPCVLPSSVPAASNAKALLNAPER